jgi:hypothetical protein
MAAETVCPRCGFKNSFTKGYLPGTCVCRVCQSQLDWREIPGAGEDCGPATSAAGAGREDVATGKGPGDA